MHHKIVVMACVLCAGFFASFFAQTILLGRRPDPFTTSAVGVGFIATMVATGVGGLASAFLFLWSFVGMSAAIACSGFCLAIVCFVIAFES